MLADPHTCGHLERVEPQRGHRVVARGDHQHILKAVAPDEPSVVVADGVDRLDHEERLAVHAAQLVAHPEDRGGLARSGGTDDERVHRQVVHRDRDVA